MSVDGEGIADDDRPELMVTLAIGSSVGGGTRVAPGARPDDGQAELVVEGDERKDDFRVNTDGEVADDRIHRRVWRMPEHEWSLRLARAE